MVTESHCLHLAAFQSFPFFLVKFVGRERDGLTIA